MGSEIGNQTDGMAVANSALWLHPRAAPDLSPGKREKIARLASELRAEDPRIDDLSPFGAGVHQGIGEGPCIWFGDTAEIPLLAQSSLKRFDYRIGWLAQDRDVVVIGGPQFPAFEDYQRRLLDAPDLKYLNVDPQTAAPRRATTSICARDSGAFETLCRAVADHDTVTLHAHIATGTIWALASRLARSTKANVCVAGPAPLVSRRANDKIWFGRVAQGLLGAAATPPKRTAFSASALTRHVADLARKWDRLVIKVPDSAGSEGNFILRSRDVLGPNLAAIHRRLMHDLSMNGRKPVFPLLVEVWDANVLTSPSVQTWIPMRNDGPPVIETIFEQVLHGENAAFAGAVPADLDPLVERQLASGALRLATLFQELGFFGRCSFDALLTGTDGQAPTLHWIECNARWGGASVPMSLVHRLWPGRAQPQYAVVQNDDGAYRAIDVAQALEEFGGGLPIKNHQSGVVFLSPNMMAVGVGCHFIAFAATNSAAAELARSTVLQLRQPPNRLQ